MKRLFTEHPGTVGETYTQHLAVASGFGWRLCTAGLACILHGLFPFLFEKTGSKAIADLHECMVLKRGNGTQPSASNETPGDQRTNVRA